MAQFGASIQTAQVTTGSFLTTVDPYTTTLTGYPSNPGNKNQLGAAYYDSTGSFAGITAANPSGNRFGAPGKYRYVRYYSTSNPLLTLLTAPAPVYWQDNTFTQVTPVSSESVTGGINSLAGILMPNVTAIPSLVNTAANSSQTQLQGNFVWICVGGYVSGVKGFTAIAADDAVIGSVTTFTPGRAVAGTASPSRVLGYAQSALGFPSAGLINLLVTLES